MHVSRRITSLTNDGSDGWEVFNKARMMIRSGIEVIELTIGEHDIRTDPIILEAMHKSAIGGHTGYAMVPGIHDLREKIAARVSERTGVKTTPDNVLVTAGGQAALFAAHMAVCDTGDRALYIDPYYATYPGTIRASGAIDVPIKTSPETGFQPSFADIAAHASGAKSLLINSPNNPTGSVYSMETMQGIAKVAQDHDLWVISDEVYDTQLWNGSHISTRALPDMADRTITIGSMSKSHAMTGSRVGWMIAPEEVIAHCINLSTTSNYGVSGFTQDAALFALNQGAAFEDKIAAPFLRRRNRALEILKNHPQIGVIPPDGAMYLMLDISKTGLSGQDFAFSLLENQKIAVMPGESFGQAAAGHIRVAMTIEDSAFDAALARLCGYAEGLMRD